MMVRARPRRYGHAEEILKKRRRRCGGIYVLADGRKVFCAFVKQKEMIRGDAKNIPDAVGQGIAGWAIDDHTLRSMRLRGIDLIAVDVEETGDKFLTHIDAFYTSGIFQWHFDKYRNHEPNRCVNLRYWRYRAGRLKFR